MVSLKGVLFVNCKEFIFTFINCPSSEPVKSEKEFGLAVWVCADMCGADLCGSKSYAMWCEVVIKFAGLRK